MSPLIPTYLALGDTLAARQIRAALGDDPRLQVVGIGSDSRQVRAGIEALETPPRWVVLSSDLKREPLHRLVSWLKTRGVGRILVVVLPQHQDPDPTAAFLRAGAMYVDLVQLDARGRLPLPQRMRLMRLMRLLSLIPEGLEVAEEEGDDREPWGGQKRGRGARGGSARVDEARSRGGPPVEGGVRGEGSEWNRERSGLRRVEGEGARRERSGLRRVEGEGARRERSGGARDDERGGQRRENSGLFSLENDTDEMLPSLGDSGLFFDEPEESPVFARRGGSGLFRLDEDPDATPRHPISAVSPSAVGRERVVEETPRSQAKEEEVGAFWASSLEPSFTSDPSRRGRGEGKVKQSHFELVGMVSSTGGLGALETVLAGLPHNFNAPIAIVQHIGKGFDRDFVKALQRRSPLGVELVEEALRPRAGRVYVSPSGQHLLFEEGLLRLSPEPSHNPYKPSGSVLFESMAQHLGGRGIGVLLTGMGRDGADGLLKLREAGGRTLVQNRETCLVYGMPRAAIQLGAAERILPLQEISGALVDLILYGMSG